MRRENRDGSETKDKDNKQVPAKKAKTITRPGLGKAPPGFRLGLENQIIISCWFCQPVQVGSIHLYLAS